MELSIADLQTGRVARTKPTSLAKLAGVRVGTIYRHIKEGKLTAIGDPQTGRVYIPCAAALCYITGERYQHNPQDIEVINRMEVARQARKQQPSK